MPPLHDAIARFVAARPDLGQEPGAARPLVRSG